MTQPNNPTNPFLKVYDAVWDLLFGDEQNNPLAGMVRIGNRVGYGTEFRDNREGIKPAVVTSDLPELILQDEGELINLHGNSTSTFYTQSLTIYCSTGDFRYSLIASLLNWYILCNMGRWRSLLTEVQWRGVNIVKNVKTVPVQIGESNPERNRDIRGWVVMWRMQLDCSIPTINLTYTEE